MKKNSENILEEQGKSVPFSICFDRLLNDLSDAADLLKKYLLNDLLIDDIKKYHKDQEALASGFKEKIDRINYDVKLIKSKKIKGRFRDIKEQNDMIINFLFDYIHISGVFFSDHGNAEEKEKARPLYEKMRVGLKTLDRVILEYNKKAQKSHIGKLITVASAGEIVKQAFEKCLKSDLF